MTNDEESRGTAAYLNDLCIRFGMSSSVFDIENFELHYDQDCASVYPSDRGEKLDCFFKLYPLEWMAQDYQDSSVDGFDDVLAGDLESIHMLEPAWKLLLGNKAILAVLWEMFPHHENLLPSYFDAPPGAEMMIENYVSKPRFAREGTGIKFSKNETLQEFV